MNSAQFEKANSLLSQEEQQKLAGRICSFCKTPLPHGAARGHCYCTHCPPAGAHHLRMDFRFQRRRWRCEFWDADAEKMLIVRLNFAHADRLYILARRGRGFIGDGKKMAKLSFFNAVANGHGAISLTLDDSQYQALRAASQDPDQVFRSGSNRNTRRSS